MTELRQNFWNCRRRQFVRNITPSCVICKKYEGPSYQYPVSPPSSELRMNNDFDFYATGINNFSPLFVRSIFAKDSSTLFKVWVTLYTCAGTRGVILDVVPHIDSTSSIKGFRRFVSKRGCPSVMISDNGRKFVSNETVEFVNGVGVDWMLIMQLAPWHGGFFERIVRSTKTLSRKALQTGKLIIRQRIVILTTENRV